ncbi:hypothetical protein [Polaromonas hydrogenivorans]|uniref:Transmembrane protein n=1 Tax=Polaromonas hydrogenivorans TaxID=335476 RepID=A0AAU7LWD8_9BURK
MTGLQIMHLAAGIVVLLEALNKLERTAPCRAGLAPRRRATEWLKALAWTLLALGAGGAVASPVLLALGVQGGDIPLMRLERPTLAETSVMLGFSVLIVRTRIKEG